uniref:peptidylprolyl isomerase n=1 Tax=Fibrocapsa japonica TaxID=94617 RepID=A0A7S2V0X6_9STRA|mmetsp:Transcript_20875/g.30220  ORF Transcript_20875/g.30220 Transcript_20875/m.30220 type:complete len:151 (+) Transcript_20875:51-503(+)|eukprot:CAMPEP_0113952566 /NCGR_PEP_ID=MMETSP1339-20121228/90497_1 /TAXON_ID=94617 /ORGANISM="Fibrocapsa japonica" /LENGTH=150 /DNA_ID=CAMNT_0000961207 /DNA_START=50 /DNA_END=502 /DNA_ORIENTATION=- /assembly_acc=CAM_ASM_000762
MKVQSTLLSLIALIVGCLAGTTPEGLEYLAQNRLKPGVIETSSGLQYTVIEEGNKLGASPAKFTKCLVDYEGHTIDGTTFDSSYERGEPITFAPNQVIAGWTEALMMMKEGSKWEVTLPSEIAYGDQSVGDVITPGSVLIFTMELHKIGV